MVSNRRFDIPVYALAWPVVNMYACTFRLEHRQLVHRYVPKTFEEVVPPQDWQRCCVMCRMAAAFHPSSNERLRDLFFSRHTRLAKNFHDQEGMGPHNIRYEKSNLFDFQCRTNICLSRTCRIQSLDNGCACNHQGRNCNKW